jgi:hypothetical protein
MRSWYLAMGAFISVIIVLILLSGSFNNGCTRICGSLTTTEASSSLHNKDGATSLPWQLDAVSIGNSHTPSEKDIPSTSDVKEISCAIKTGIVKSRFCN